MAFNIIVTLILMEYIRPFMSSSESYLAKFNEVFLLIIMYHLMCFSYLDQETKILVGFSFCLLEAVNILANLAMATYAALKMLLFDLRIRWAKRNLRKLSKLTALKNGLCQFVMKRKVKAQSYFDSSESASSAKSDSSESSSAQSDSEWEEIILNGDSGEESKQDELIHVKDSKADESEELEEEEFLPPCLFDFATDAL